MIDFIAFATVLIVSIFVLLAAIEQIPSRNLGVLTNSLVAACILALLTVNTIGSATMNLTLVIMSVLSAVLFSRLPAGAARSFITTNHFATDAAGFDIDPSTVNIVEFPMDRVVAARPYDYQEEA